MYPIRPRVSDNSLRRPCSCLLYMSSPIGDRYAVCRILLPCVCLPCAPACVRACLCVPSTKFPPSMCGAEDICAQPQEKNFPSIAAAFFFIFALLELAHMRRDHGPARPRLKDPRYFIHAREKGLRGYLDRSAARGREPSRRGAGRPSPARTYRRAPLTRLVVSGLRPRARGSLPHTHMRAGAREARSSSKLEEPWRTAVAWARGRPAGTRAMCARTYARTPAGRKRWPVAAADPGFGRGREGHAAGARVRMRMRMRRG